MQQDLICEILWLIKVSPTGKGKDVIIENFTCTTCTIYLYLA